MAVVWFWTAIITPLVTFWKKLSRAIEAVPGGTRKQTGLPCETLLDRGPLLSVPQGQMASPLDVFRGVSDQFRPLRRIAYLKAQLFELVAQLIGAFPVAGCSRLVALAYQGQRLLAQYAWSFCLNRIQA
jgi:hypothetical protein